MRPGGEELCDAGCLESFLHKAKSSPQASSSCAHYHCIIGVVYNSVVACKLNTALTVIKSPYEHPTLLSFTACLELLEQLMVLSEPKVCFNEPHSPGKPCAERPLVYYNICTERGYLQTHGAVS